MTRPPFALLQATIQDLDEALPVVREFYRHFQYPWDEPRKRGVLTRMMDQPEFGQLHLVRRQGSPVGYALLAFYLSLEFNGRVAILDEFYLLPDCRGHGLGRWILDTLTARLAAEEVSVTRLEVDEHQPEAAGFYARCGFHREGRQLWSRATALPLASVGTQP